MKKPSRKLPIYYSDELNDDFASNNTKRAEVYGRVHIEREGFYAFVSNVFFYCVAIPIAFPLFFLTGVLFKKSPEFKALKKSKAPYFFMANHAGVKDVIGNYLLALPRRSNTVGYSNAEDGFFLRHLVPLLGFIPVPDDLHQIGLFNHALKWSVSCGQPVSVFPEAHLWPTYTKVRNFSKTSFRYPVRFGVPVVPVFYARRKRRGFWRLFKHPRVTVLVGKPIYPDASLPEAARVQKLRDETYEALVALSQSLPQEEYWHYVYRPLKGDKAE